MARSGEHGGGINFGTPDWVEGGAVLQPPSLGSVPLCLGEKHLRHGSRTSQPLVRVVKRACVPCQRWRGSPIFRCGFKRRMSC